MKRIRHYSYGILALSVFLFALAAVALPSAAALSAEGIVRRAWQRVQRLGVYDFATELTQTQTPGPALANVGRSSSTQTVYMEGRTDQPAQTMELRLWQNGGSTLTGRDGLEIRIADGKAYGRTIGEESWREISDFTDAFAPAQDPLGYLAGAENLREVGKETREGVEFTRYAFDLNGPRFAAHMRDQIEQELTAKGELPSGVELSLADEYVQMSGTGEIWLNAQELPLRLTVHVDYPEEADGDRISADIQTDFSGYPEAAAANRAGAWLAGTLHLPRTSDEWQRAAQHSGMALGVLGLVILLITAANSRKLYVAVAVAVIVSTIISPILQSQQVAAFSEKASTERAAQEAEQTEAEKEREVQRQMNTSTWNANTDPLAAAESAQQFEFPAELAATQSSASAVSLLTETTPDPNSDADGDGLTYAQETALGTLPDSADSDGDGLTDNVEVRGFSYGGRPWYTDPRYYDTDMDGLTDMQECPQRQRESQTQLSPDVPCQDTDSDGTPDIFDRDSDNDGLPDKSDLSPTALLGAAATPFTYATPFNLIINDAQANKPLVVDLQVRPKNPVHLTYALNVLDWPSGDHGGQVQRSKGNHQTYADVTPGGPASDANGDMRLIPMLEIEMSGATIPLPLTTTLQAQSYLEGGEIEGQIQMTQPAGQPVRMDFTFANSQPYTVTVYAVGATCPTGKAVYTLTHVLNGDVRTLSGISLIDLANGQRLVGVAGGGKKLCADLGNVINGPYPDRMVDLAAMETYGVAVREKDTRGVLLAYVPLNVVTDESDGGRVGFAGRMYYQPGASWGDAHQMRLVWLVDALVDRCTTRPADSLFTQEQWCNQPGNWVLNQSQIIQTYADEWYLAGMMAREDHGLEMAVVFEDPATDTEPGVDASLWHLTEGLEGVFLTARDENEDGVRDLTIPEIVRRFDSQHNTGVSDEQRWDIPQNALRVLTYTFTNADQAATLPMTHTRQILQTYFTAPDGSAKVSAPTFLFVQEQRARYASLGMSAAVVRTSRVGNAVADNQLTLSINGDVITEAAFKWAPYRLRGGAWEAYPIDEYVALLAATMRPILASDTEAYQGLTATETTKALNAQALMVQGYYISLYQGVSAVVQNGVKPVRFSTPPPDLAFSIIKTVGSYAKRIIGPLVKKLVLGLIKGLMKVITHILKLIDAALNPLKIIINALETVMKIVNTLVGLVRFVKYFCLMFTSAVGLATLALAVVTAVIFIISCVVAAAITAIVGAAVAGVAGVGLLVAIILSPNVLSTALAAYTLISSTFNLLVTLVTTTVTVIKGIVSIVKAAGDITKLVSAAGITIGAILAVISWIISVIVAIGVFAVQVLVLILCGYSLSSPEVKTLLAELVTSLAMSLLTLLIGMMPIIGGVLLGLIGVIDALIGVICAVIPNKDPTAAKLFCKGVSGLLNSLFSGALYSYAVLASMDDPKRLSITSFGASMADPAQGVKAGQQLLVQVGVRNQIDSITEWDSMQAGLIYAIVYRFTDVDSIMQQMTFAYRLQTVKQNFSQTLALGQNAGQWAQAWAWDHPYYPSRRPGNGPYSMAASAVNTITLTTPGINSHPTLYLSEAYVLPAHECWMIWLDYRNQGASLLGQLHYDGCKLVPVTGDNHIDLSAVLEFDIFPATLDGFYTLTARDGGYALAWSQTDYPVFPRLKDADGDGLLNKTDGGSDPDDSQWDSDGDSLSDYFEAQKGTNPLSADTDGDGLSDADELSKGTDPFKADSDGDGLTDPVELAGWEFIYGFAAGQPLRTWVWSDPQARDADGDGLNDAREKAFGFNPHVADEANVLAYNAALAEVQPGGVLMASDGVVKPGDTLRYTGTVENLLNARYAQGLLSTDFPAAVSGSVPPQNFILQPLDKATMNGQVQIASTTASGILNLTQTAGALVTDPRAASGGANLLLHFADATDATTFLDDSGSFRRHNATCTTGSCPLLMDVNGVFGRFAYFDSSSLNSRLTVADAPDLRSGAFTLSLWYLWQQPFNDTPVFLTSKGYENLEILLSGRAGMPVTLSVIAAGHPNTTLAVTLPNHPYGWHHVAAVYTGNALTVYWDGVLMGSKTGLAGGRDLAANTAPLTLGRRSDGAYPYTGGLDEVRLYPRALSIAEVQSLYHQPLLKFGFNQSPNGEWWPDESGQSYAGWCMSPMCIAIPTPDGIYQSAVYFVIPQWGLQVRPTVPFDFSAGRATVSLWVHPRYTEPKNATLIGPIYTGLNRAEPSLILRGKSVVFGYGDGSVWREVRWDNVLNLADWNHLLVTLEDQTARLYVNGVLQSALVIPGAPPVASREMAIGQNFTGLLDEVALYAQAFTAEEALADYRRYAVALDLPLDDAPGSRTFQDATQQNSAACSGAGCPVSGVPGRVNQAVAFDGVDDALRVPDSAALRPAVFSLSAWFKWDDMGTNNVQFITGKKLEHFEMHTGGAAGVNGLRVIPAGYSRSAVDVPNFIQPGWNHVVVTYDGKTVLIYRNGAQVGSRTGIEGMYDASSDFAPFWVGRRSDGGYPFHGAIDAVQIYNRVLTAAEVGQLYRAAPLFLLRLDEGVGATQFSDAFSSKTASCSGATCPVSVRGQLGNALDFDGIDDRLQGVLADAATDNVSLLAWVNWAGVNGKGQMIAYNGNSAADGYGLYLAADGTLSILNGGVNFATAAPKPAQDSWEHIAAVREKGVWKLYINGSLVPVSLNPVPRTPTAAFYVGANNAGNDNFNGRIDHVALYVTALSAVDVRAIYQYQSQWVEERQSFALTVDADKPTSTLQSNAAYRPNRDGVLHVAAADATSAVDKVELGVNGAWSVAPLCTDATSAWCPTFNPAAFSGEGVYTLQTRATDRAGNVETPGAGVTFYVDATPPNVGATLPTSAAAPQRAGDLWTVALAGTVNDPVLPGGAAGSGVASVHVALYDASGVTAGQGEQATTVTGNAWAATYAFPTAPTGAYTVSVTAADAVGNARTTVVGVLTLDGAAPTASLDKTDVPTDAITSTLTLRGLVSELPSLTSQLFHLALEEDAGATAFYDSNGRGVNGACSGATCPTAGIVGQNGRALGFDGADDLVTISDQLDLNLTTFSVGGWVKPEQVAANWQALIVKGNPWGHYRNYGLWIKPDALTLDFGFKSGADCADYYTYVSHSSLPLNIWTHVMMTYDGAALKLYLNGQLDNAVSVTVTPCQTAGAVQIGRLSSGDAAFHGALDDLRVFSRALEPNEIALLAQSQVAGVSQAAVAFTPAMPGSPFYNDIAPAGQVLHLPLESAGMEAGASVLRDVSGNRAHGICEGTACPTLGVASPAYGGAQFDGIDDGVRIPHNPMLNPTQYTLSAWFKWDDLSHPSVQILTMKNVTHYELHTLGDNDLRFIAAGWPNTFVDAPDFIQPGWNHVVATYDGSTATLYRNGVQVAQRTGLTGVDLTYDQAPLSLGGAPGYAFHGALDDVRLFNRVLSPAEIQALYWSAGPEFRLDFEETALKSGDFTADSSARGHDGLLFTGDAAPKSTTGQVGQGALSLDGVNDSVNIALPALSPGQYTLSLWFQWDDIGSNQVQFITARGWEHLEMHTGGDSGINGLRVIPAGYPETHVDVPNVIQPGWNHVVVTYDGSAVYVYRNGVLAGSRTGITGGEVLTTDGAPFLLGRRSDAAVFFDGALDDVQLYARILSPAEIHDLYVQGWQAATLSQNSNGMAHWSAAVPTGLEGDYQIALRGQDAFGNSAQSALRPWQGTIDTFAPRVSLTKATLGAGATLRYQYTCTAEDFALTEAGFVCPCASQSNKTFYQSPWYQAASNVPSLYRLTASCTVSAQSPVSEMLTACDRFGNCASTGVSGLAMAPLEATEVTLDAAITEPADGAVLATTPVTVSGAAYAINALRALTVTADAAVIHTQSWGGTLTETTWSFAWTPAAEGAHVLTAIVRDAAGAVLTQTTPITVYVDTSAPTLAIASDVLTTTHYRPSGEVSLAGTVADAGGVSSVLVGVTAAGDTFLTGTSAQVAGTTWRAPWVVGVATLPAGETYTVTAVATDLAGRVVTATRAITVDLTAPATMTLGLNGDLALPPATVTLTWTASSDASGLGDYRGVWQTWLTDTVATAAFTRPASGPRAVTTTVQEGQKVVAQVAAQDAYGNQTWQTYGPFYADSPATPDYAALDYRGWLETGCTALGTDARIRDKATANSALKAAQQFYLTWDSAALRMTWTGANWDEDGDLFIYLDTQPGGATQAYNPYPATISNTAILLPVQRTVSVTHQAATLSPRAARATAADQMEADALLWVRDSATALLMVWNGSAWAAADGLDYAFDATLDAPTTDLRVPFGALGITHPATATLALVAFATENDALRLWATMPPLNSVNSPRLLDAKRTGDVERFALTHRYEWATLGDGVCVNASQAMGRGPQSVNAPQAAPQAYNADVRFTFQAEPEGIAYSVLEDNNFFLMDNLDTFADWTDWAAWDAEFCAEFPDDPECQRELEARAAGQRRAPQQGGGLDFNAQNGLSSAQDTAHPPVGDGDIVTYTLRYTNRGTARATGLIADIITWGPVRLPDAQEYYADEFEETYYLTLDLGDLDPGQTLTATFTGQIDVTCDITNNVGWATLDISLYDDSTSLEAPLDWVYIDHKVDQSGPLITLQVDPALVAPGVNTLHGLMVDESSVATITLEIEDSWGVTSTVEFHDPTPDDGRWEYTWDIGDAEEGDWYYVAVMAEDVYGQAGEWSRWYLLTVDATPPVLTLDATTEAALEDGIIGPAETAFSGALNDNRMVADVQACQGAICESANTQSDAATLPQTPYTYDDAPATPLPINAGTACEGGAPVVRTFNVSDAFVVADVAVGLNITHEFRYDVDVTLVSPAGTSVNILWDGTDAQNYDVLLSDDALARNADDWQDHDPAAPYYETVIRPDEPLEFFAGEDAQGQWQLTICDYFPEEDDGAYNRSRLVLTADVLPENTAAAWSYTVPLSDSVDGALQTVTFYGLDSAGNRSASTVRTFRADNVAPVVTVTTAIPELFWGAQTPVLGGLVSDGTGVANVTIVGLTPAQTMFYATAGESAAGQWQYTLSEAWPGTYTLWVQAEDAAGNMTTVGPYTVLVKGAPLTLSKTVTPTVEVQPGGTVTYTLVLHNGGEEAVADLVITDTVTSTLHTLTPTPPGTLAIVLGNTLTWGPLAIAAGDTYTFSFTAVVTETVGSGALVTNQASFYAPATGPGVSTAAAFFTAQGNKIYLPLVIRNG